MSKPSDNERDPETLALFIEESLEGLQRVEKILLDGEKAGFSSDAIPTLFRDVHTIKGTSASRAEEDPGSPTPPRTCSR